MTETFDELARELGSRVAKIQDTNNAAITRVAEQFNLNHATRAQRTVQIMDRLEKAGRDMRVAQADMNAALEDLKALEMEANDKHVEAHAELLFLRKVNEPKAKRPLQVVHRQ